MPNIVLVGFNYPSFSKKVSKVVTELGIKPEDGVITCCHRLVCFDMTEAQDPAPYLIVRDTQKKRADMLAKALNEKLNMDIEVEIIRKFLPKKK
jgi:hypothetical protein